MKVLSLPLVVVLTVLTGVGQLPAQPVFRAGIDLVHFAVTVEDRKGSFLSDLTSGDFELYEEGVKQTILYFAQGVSPDRLPLHLGLLFDTSLSMEKDLETARTAAVKFLNALPDAKDMTLVDFDTEVRIARFSQADFPRLVERIRTRKPEGWTALYDAMGVYLDGAGFQDGQKILVMYTDGGDTRSNLTFSDALDLVKASDVTIYSIGFLQNQGSGRTEQRMSLLRVAEQSGGRAFFPNSIDDIEDAYDGIVAEIGARYVIGYTSTNTRADGAWRKVEIKLRRDGAARRDARVRVRPGYFAPYRESAR